MQLILRDNIGCGHRMGYNCERDIRQVSHELQCCTATVNTYDIPFFDKEFHGQFPNSLFFNEVFMGADIKVGFVSFWCNPARSSVCEVLNLDKFCVKLVCTETFIVHLQTYGVNS